MTAEPAFTTRKARPIHVVLVHTDVVHLQRKFNEEMARYIKRDLGYKGLILGGNWQTHDEVCLADTSRYATIPPSCDCIGYHRYAGSPTGSLRARDGRGGASGYQVEYEIVADKPSGQRVDEAALKGCIDRAGKTVRSVTGELLLNWGGQLLTVDTPCAQGAVGLTGKAGRIVLRDVEIESHNDLSSLLVVSMNGKPLAQSGKILIQAVTPSHLSGWKVKTLAENMPVTLKDENGKVV